MSRMWVGFEGRGLLVAAVKVSGRQRLQLCHPKNVQQLRALVPAAGLSLDTFRVFSESVTKSRDGAARLNRPNLVSLAALPSATGPVPAE